MTNKDKCIEMWEDISRHGGCKEDYFARNAITDIPLHGCYACEEASTPDERSRCLRCPLYAGTNTVCYNDNEPFQKWGTNKSKYNAEVFLKFIKDNWK